MALCLRANSSLSMCMPANKELSLSLSLAWVYVFMPAHKELSLSLSHECTCLCLRTGRALSFFWSVPCFCMHYAVNCILERDLHFYMVCIIAIEHAVATCKVSDCCIYRESTVEVQTLLDKILCISGGTLLHYLIVWNLIVWIIIVS